jgi:hypothetical protein
MNKRKLNFAQVLGHKTNSKARTSDVKPKKAVLGQVNFNLGSPLKPKPIFSDSKGNPIDLNLKLRQASDKSRIEDSALIQTDSSKSGNQKIKQKKLSEEFSTSKSSTTSTPTSTTTPPATTSTTSSVGETTSSNTFLTSSINTNQKENMAYRGKRDYNERSNKPNTIGFSGSEISGADGFRKDENASMIGILYGNGDPKKVDFNLHLLCTNYLNDYETSVINANEVRPKLILRTTSFSGQLVDAFNDPTGNIDLYNVLQAIYKKFDSDVGNTLNSYTSPNWSFSTFVNGLVDIAKGLEYYYFLDSVLAYDAASMGTDNISRVSEQYKSLISSNQSLVIGRSTLRSFLKGAWFPSNFAQLIRYFYQGYKINPLQQSTVFRYIPDKYYLVSDINADTLYSATTAVDNLTAVINNLKPGTNAAKLSTILNKVYPKGRLSSFPKSCSDNLYDVLMYEIFANESIAFLDINSANALSFYPISYRATVNDIPYYMDADPISSLNGLAYALQSVPTAKTATSGYVASYFTGIRKPIAANMTDIINNATATNLQLVDNSSGSIKGYAPSAKSNASYINTYCAHRTMFAFSGAASTALQVTSQSPANMQRVYFNNDNGPKLLMNEMINNLFQTRA